MRIKLGDQVRALYRAVRNHDGDNLPTALVVLGGVLSVGGLVVGLLFDWTNLVMNVAANLVVLGPGLLITNYLVRAWRDRGLTTRMVPQIELLLTGIVRMGDLAVDLGEKLKLSLPAHEWERFLAGGERTAVSRIPAMGSALSALFAALPEPDKAHFDGDLAELSVTIPMVNVPPMSLVERVVGHLDRLKPMPEAYLSASKLQYLHDSRYFRTVFNPKGRGPIDGVVIPDGYGISDVRKGFDDFARYAMEHSAPEEGASPVTVKSWDYYMAIWIMLMESVRLLIELEKYLPVGVRAQFQKELPAT